MRILRPGACLEPGPWDGEADKASGAKITHFVGYLWDPPRDSYRRPDSASV
ncbi:hypothetical protein DBIPINDM_007596 (plasmid) [Mesorhizobium sp. AR02]|uniref:hypothetical protein n=1 Tax=Mesorhizobium sp. AR02 TaxID=2865837 RepID=UPI0021603809|nr:hypothetical protein DBIPINDM_007596 [Mesorhizobium sp. AR02]